MHLPSLLFGTSILAVTWGLESHRRRHEPVLSRATDLDRTYMSSRRRGRVLTNVLMAVIGCLAAIAGLIGTGQLWMILWALIPAILVVIVVLALCDALRTDRYLRAKIPELREQVFATGTDENRS